VIAYLGPLVGWLHLAALTLSIGAVTTLAFVARPGLNSGEVWQREQALRVGSLATLVLAAIMLLVFLRQLVEFRDPFASWSDDARLLLGSTDWGRAWIAGLAVSVLAAASFATARTRSDAWLWLGAPAVLASGVFPAWTGHANSGGPLRPVALAADVLHVWAAGSWIGGLAVVVLIEYAWRMQGRGAADLLPRLVPRFSRVAVLAVPTLLLTGALASWIHVGGTYNLIASRYGRILLFKLALVTIVMGLGLISWRRLTPGLAQVDGSGRLRRAATAELVVGQVVLLATALLVHTAPMEP